ncbi:MAG: capsular biosynthesis protein [Chitinophagaceae bacterium]|nr:capsular biosynthesis protein [Chitinophagaceae bacterium]
MLFNRRKKEFIDLSFLRTDIHSHLIPGIDDGAQNTEDSLEFIKGLSELGFKKIITTPHVLWEMYPNTPEIITSGLAELRNAIVEADIAVEISAAAEYYIDEHFQEHLKNRIPLLPISENMVLVEYSMITTPMDLKGIFFEMQLQGYHPVIAHPERYIYLKNNKSFFDDLKDAGYLFQINLLSMIGYYGIAVQELSEYLIKKKYYDFAGTDLHSRRHLQLLRKVGSSKLYNALIDSNPIKNTSL